MFHSIRALLNPSTPPCYGGCEWDGLLDAYQRVDRRSGQWWDVVAPPVQRQVRCASVGLVSSDWHDTYLNALCGVFDCSDQITF